MTVPEAIVLFGASGFIGRNIVQALRDEVPVLIGVNQSGRPVPGCHRTLPLTALDQVPPLPRSCAIIHVAAFRYAATLAASQQSAITAANLALTQAVYAFAEQRGIKEVRCASSAAVYPAEWALLDDRVPLDLNGWPHPGEASYAWSKRWGEIAAELWHRRCSINTISFRLTNPFGPHDTTDAGEAHVATAFVIRALGRAAEFELRGNPDAERDFVFSGDVARVFAASLALTDVHESVNLARGTTTRIVDLAAAAMRAAGTERPLRLHAAPTNAGVAVRRASAGRLHEILPGLAPFLSLEDGLARTVAWYRDVLR